MSAPIRRSRRVNRTPIGMSPLERRVLAALLIIAVAALLAMVTA